MLLQPKLVSEILLLAKPGQEKVHSKVNLVNIAGYRRTRGIPQSIAEHKHR